MQETFAERIEMKRVALPMLRRPCTVARRWVSADAALSSDACFSASALHEGYRSGRYTVAAVVEEWYVEWRWWAYTCFTCVV